MTLPDNIEVINGLGFHRASGEAFRLVLNAEDDSVQSCKATGWTFYNVAQMLPDSVEQSTTGIAYSKAQISPWAFATPDAANQLCAKFAKAGFRTVSEVEGDFNLRFPYFDAAANKPIAQRYIRFTEPGSGKFQDRNAGLIASAIARTGAERAVLNEVLADVSAALSEEQE